jgi:hypothetical protein
MRASDIIGKPAWHDSGVRIGIVHDIRAVQDEPFGSTGALRVTGIVVGRGSLGVRLGYGSAEQTGPALLHAIFGRRARHARHVPWNELRVEPDRIVVTTGLDAMRNPVELDA